MQKAYVSENLIRVREPDLDVTRYNIQNATLHSPGIASKPVKC